MSRKSELRAIEEQKEQDEKWKDYELPEGFVPNKALLFGFQILYALVPLVCAVVLMVLTIAPLCAGQSVTTFIADIVSCATAYVIRAVVSLLIVLGVLSIALEAGTRVGESLSLDFAGVKKRAIRVAIVSFLFAGVLPLVLCFVGKKVKIGGFQASWAIPMALMSLINLISVIVESVIKKDVKTGKGEEPSVLYKSFLSVYGEKVRDNQKKVNVVRELITSIVILGMLAIQIAVPFTSEKEYLTEERVAALEETEDLTFNELLDVLGAPAYGVKAEGEDYEMYIFYGSEMDCSVFSGQANLALLTVAQYAEEKNKVISACIVTVENSKVTDLAYYEDITDVGLDIDFGFWQQKQIPFFAN